MTQLAIIYVDPEHGLMHGLFDENGCVHKFEAFTNETIAENLPENAFGICEYHEAVECDFSLKVLFMVEVQRRSDLEEGKTGVNTAAEFVRDDREPTDFVQLFELAKKHMDMSPNRTLH